MCPLKLLKINELAKQSPLALNICTFAGNQIPLKSKISILGCGWLGLDLAKALFKSGYEVKGSTTSEEKLSILQKNSITPHLIALTENGINGNINDFLKGSEILIINVPPGLKKNPNKNHVKEMSHLVEILKESSIQKVIYVSSSSVFKDGIHFPIITEKTTPNNTSNSALQLIEIEQIFSSIESISTTVVRFSGLVGNDRHPAYFLQGRQNIPNPEGPINLIHKTDCIAIISQIIDQMVWGAVFNASYPDHPSRKWYYTDFCKRHQLDAPSFSELNKSKGKQIDSSYLVQTLKYTFNKRP